MLKRIALISLVLIILFSLFCIPVFAIDNVPSNIKIVSAEGYEGVITDDDMLFTVKFEVTYGSAPTESIDTTYLVRLLNGTTELKSVAPYGYYDLGWHLGVVGLYFSATEVTTLGMSYGSTYTVRLDGNPTASWTGSPIPSASPFNSITWHPAVGVSAQDVVVSNTILNDYAVTLQAAWNPVTYILWQNAGGVKLLTSQGMAYFGNVIPYFSVICSSILTSYQTTPELVTHTPSGATQTGIINTFLNSIFDISALGTQWGLPNQLLSSLLAIGLMIAAIVGISRKINSTKPAVLLMFPMLVCFTLIGWIPLAATVLLAFIAIVGTIYIFTYEKSGA